jgi:uncharacterized membrane protein
MAAPAIDPSQPQFPTAAGVLLGLGLGGFFDGIVLHQLLQWHHMLSSWYPINSVENLELNTLWDGLFHSATYVFVVVGIFLIWRRAQQGALLWSPKRLVGAILLGWGLFNLVEGLIDHELLGVHHVNERVPPAERRAWDFGFLLWGGVMAVAGWLTLKSRGHGAAGKPQ